MLLLSINLGWIVLFPLSLKIRSVVFSLGYLPEVGRLRYSSLVYHIKCQKCAEGPCVWFSKSCVSVSFSSTAEAVLDSHSLCLSSYTSKDKSIMALWIVPTTVTGIKSN